MKRRRLFLTVSILSFVFSVTQYTNENIYKNTKEDRLTFEVEKKGNDRELIPINSTNDTIIINSYSQNPIVYFQQDTFSFSQDSQFRYLIKNKKDTVITINAEDLMTYHYKNELYHLKNLEKNSWQLTSEGDYSLNVSYDKKEDQLMLEGEITEDFYLELAVLVYAVKNLKDSSSLVIVGLALAALSGILRATAPHRNSP